MVIFLIVLFLIIIVIVWQRRNEQKRRRLVLRQLRSWLGAQQGLDPMVQRWANGLSPREASVLLDLLTGYCTSLNWELHWLFAPQLQKVPALKQAVEEGVMAYAGSILASLQLVEDVQAYHAYVALLQKPNSGQQFTLIQKLYNALSTQGVIQPIPKKRQWFSRQPTRKQKIAAVIESFDREPTRAMTTLKALLETEAMADVQQLTNLARGLVSARALAATA